MLLTECLPPDLISPGFIPAMAYSIIYRLGRVGCKSILRIVERAAVSVGREDNFNDVQEYGEAQVEALNEMLGAMNGGSAGGSAGAFFSSDSSLLAPVITNKEEEIKTSDDLFLDETGKECLITLEIF